MPGETVTLQVGQCGNQVGLQYWQQLALEHGLNNDGSSTPYPMNRDQLHFEHNDQSTATHFSSYREDHPELFYTLSESTNTYTPRSILIDLEPSVINKCMTKLPMINPRNVHLSEQGNGAANNWLNGYHYGNENIEELINLIDRELDKCDNLSNFQLIHSVAGGTGSGVGSKLLEILNDRFNHKKLINTFSIFPSNEKTSDVVVQPYNSILTLKRLIEFSDATFIFHNDALNNIENIYNNKHNNLIIENKDNKFQSANKLIANITCSLSNPLRFPSYMYSSMESILSTLIPTPDLKFLTSSISPFSSTNSHHVANEYDMILELSNDKYKTNRVTSSISYISMMNYLIGNNLDRREIRKGILKAQQRTNFVPWTTSSVSIVHGKKSPYLNNVSLDGIQVTNNTSIVDVFTKIIKQYDLLVKRKAYLNTYTEDNSIDEQNRLLGMFDDCRESVMKVVEEYKACQKISYFDDDDIDIDM